MWEVLQKKTNLVNHVKFTPKIPNPTVLCYWGSFGSVTWLQLAQQSALGVLCMKLLPFSFCLFFFIQGCMRIISNPYWLNSFWLARVQGGRKGYFYSLMTPSVWTIHRKGALSCQGWGLSLLSFSCCVNDTHIWAHFKLVYLIYG